MSRSDLTDRIADLEQQLAATTVAGRQRQARPALSFPPRHVRLALTCNDPVYGTYPAKPANTFPIKMQNAIFTEAGGNQAVTATDRSAAGKFYARTIDGTYLPINSAVAVLNYGGRWWILKSGTVGAALLAKWTGATIWNPGSNSSNAVEVFAGAAPETDQFTTVTALNRFHTIMPGDFVFVIQNTDAWYVVADFSDVLFGQMQSTNLAPGGTGTFHILDPSTGSAGTAFTDTGLTVTAYTAVPLVKNDVVMLFWNRINTTNDFAFYAVPLSRPLLGKATATINYKTSGSVEVYDSAVVDLGTSVSAFASQRQIAKNEWCKLFFDTNKQKWVAYPLNVPLLGKNQSSDGAVTKGNVITPFEIFDDQYNDQGFSLSNVRALVNIGANAFCKAFWDAIQNEWFAEPFAFVPSYGGLQGSAASNISTSIQGHSTLPNVLGSSQNITVDPANGKIVLTAKGTYRVLCRCRMEHSAGSDESTVQVFLNFPATVIASAHLDSKDSVNNPTHVNLTTGNPDAFAYTCPVKDVTLIDVEDLVIGDEITVQLNNFTSTIGLWEVFLLVERIG